MTTEEKHKRIMDAARLLQQECYTAQLARGSWDNDGGRDVRKVRGPSARWLLPRLHNLHLLVAEAIATAAQGKAIDAELSMLAVHTFDLAGGLGYDMGDMMREAVAMMQNGAKSDGR